MNPTMMDQRQKVSLSMVQDSCDALQEYLWSQQHAPGYWCGELECDVTPTADYILLRHFLLRNSDSAQRIASDPRVAKAAARILSKQNADGGWPIYHGGPGEISATVKAYFALKLAGFPAEDPRLRQAARFIRDHGGVVSTNSYMKFYLALFGQWPWARVPAMPPELFLLPPGFVFNLYAMSSWSRAILVPMFVLYGLRPAIQVPESMGIPELVSSEGRGQSMRDAKTDAWGRFFYRVDFVLKGVEKNPLKPWREKALAACRDWILEHLPLSQGLGSIWPGMINAVMALDCMDFPGKERLMTQQIKEIEALVLEDENTLRVQPCFSPVWDTAIAVLALTQAGVSPQDKRLQAAGEWLLSKEVKQAGDWRHANPAGKPGGWYFQYANEFYPDTDDTAMVLLALHALDMGSRSQGAIDRAVSWLISMQNQDGGWGAFDKNNARSYLTKVPFADHNAMIDPSSCDVSARILEALGTLRAPIPPQAMQRAFAYLRRNKEDDGTWFGRWGVNYIYGSWSVSNAQRAWSGNFTGLDLSAALGWLKRVQNADGGWGESCASYDDARRKGQGPSTASQTAWALNAFFNAGIFDDAAVQRGVAYLCRKTANGAVEEPEFTGTGFPRVFYLNYHLYRVGFPLMALARYRAYLQD